MVSDTRSQFIVAETDIVMDKLDTQDATWWFARFVFAVDYVNYNEHKYFDFVLLKKKHIAVQLCPYTATHEVFKVTMEWLNFKV